MNLNKDYVLRNETKNLENCGRKYQKIQRAKERSA